jgi:hypothetical protein
MFRTDENNNPAAFTTDIASQAGLVKGVDYVDGNPFPAPSTLTTAKLLGDPIAITIRVINAIGYRTHLGTPRWTYICLPRFLWNSLPDSNIAAEPRIVSKVDIIGYHYQMEGGVAMRDLFPNYGQQ